MERLIDKLAKKHNDWIAMAKSFKCSDDTANEIVQEMYVRLSKYIDDPEKIMYDQDELNTYYVYVTLRNIYLTNHQRSRKFIEYKPLGYEVYEDADIPREEAFEKILSMIEKSVGGWYWYDKKLWEIHFHRQMSMRQIATATKISLSSIFNTLKNSKNKIRQEFGEDIDDYFNEDYERI